MFRVKVVSVILNLNKSSVVLYTSELGVYRPGSLELIAQLSRDNCDLCTLYLYYGETRDLRANIGSRLREFPRAKPKGTLKDMRLYLTIYPELRHHVDSITFNLI